MERPALGIDTATRRGSIALSGGPAAGPRMLAEGGWHARDLLAAVETLLGEAGLAAGRLGGIGVAAGPGSFTGVRIGMATAKGLGLALDIPVEGFSTLEATAGAAAGALGGRPAVIAVVLEAGRGEVYGALFRSAGAGVQRLGADATWKPADLAAGLPPEALLAGDGAARVRDAGASREETPVPPLAPWIAAAARGRIGDGAAYRAGGPGPNYVRPPDAEPARRSP